MAKKQGKKNPQGSKGLLTEYVSDGAKKGENLGFKALLGAQIKDDEKNKDRSGAIREVLKSEEPESGFSSEIRQVLNQEKKCLEGLQVFFLGAGDQLKFHPAEAWKAAWETSSMVYETDGNASLCVRKADGEETSFETTSKTRVRVCGSTVYLESVPT